MKKQLLTILFLPFMLTLATGQQINIGYQSVSNGLVHEYEQGICALRSGDWLVARTKIDNAPASCSLRKISATGQTIWEKNIESHGDSIFQMTELYDGRILILYNQPANTIALFDSTGQELWAKNYSLPDANGLTKILNYPIHISSAVVLPGADFMYIAGNFQGAAKTKISLHDGALLNVDSANLQYSYAAVTPHPTNPKRMIWMFHTGQFQIFEGDTLVYTATKPVPYPGYSRQQRIYSVKGVPQMIMTGLHNTVFIFDSVGIIKKIISYTPDNVLLQSEIIGFSDASWMKFYRIQDLDQAFDSIPQRRKNIRFIGNSYDQSLMAGAVITGPTDNSALSNNGFLYPYQKEHGFLLSVNKNGVQTAQQTDIGVVSISNMKIIPAVINDPSSSNNFVRVFNSLVNISIKNHGNTPVTQAELCYVTTHAEIRPGTSSFPSGLNFLPIWHTLALSNLNLQPGATMMITIQLPDSVFLEQSTGFYAWTMLPDGHTDDNLENDAARSNTIFYPVSALATFHYFPNPVRDHLFVTLPYTNLFGAQFRIYSMTGQAVLDGIVQSDQDYYFINTAPLGAGMYILKVGDNTVKFIKE